MKTAERKKIDLDIKQLDTQLEQLRGDIDKNQDILTIYE